MSNEMTDAQILERIEAYMPMGKDSPTYKAVEARLRGEAAPEGRVAYMVDGELWLGVSPQAAPAAPAPVVGDAVAKLPEKWRNRAGDGVFPVGAGKVFADTNRENADELEAALAQDRASQGNQ